MRSVLLSGSTQDTASPGEKQAISKLLRDAQGLPALRSAIATQTISRQAAFSTYNTLNNDVYGYLDQLIISQETEIPLVTNSLALVRVGESEEMMAREQAVLLGDLAARQFPAPDLREFTQIVGARRALYALNLPALDQQYRVFYTRGGVPQALAALTQVENKIMADRHPGKVPPPVSPAALMAAIGPTTAVMTRASNQAAAALVHSATTAAISKYEGLGVEGGIGLILVLVSILVAVLTSRSLVRELTGLRQSALALANERLPEVVDRLALGQEVDVTAEAPGIHASSDEIGQVRDAFATVQETAVRAAVGQARLRQGMSEVFRNLARRSQSLLHRQLTLLDSMERRARDPQELEDLFRIDHLTTRMRRHAESLIVLAGHTPARGWRNPVPLVDVLRAAVAEVEDYTRIRATSSTRASLAGPAVGDVIHMIAELAENATMFSPPNTPVVIHGDTVGKGFAIEIEDRGLGLSDEQRDRFNALLENPPPFDPAGSDQLGLFVAGQLAKRHDIKISLRPSPYGGTTAIVLIPNNLVVPEGSHAKDPIAPAVTEASLGLKGRHAALGLTGPETGPGAGMAALEPAGAPEPPGPLGAPGAPGGLGAPGAWAAAEVPAMRAAADTADLGVAAGLPRRVRQASLAPQLKEGSPDMLPAPVGDDFWARPPEETRSTMSAIQQGWERGRSVFDVAPASPDTAGETTTAGPVVDPGPGGTHGPEPASDDRGTSG
jgi:signal transduction histidine kinase